MFQHFGCFNILVKKSLLRIETLYRKVIKLNEHFIDRHCVFWSIFITDQLSSPNFMLITFSHNQFTNQ